MTVPYACDCVCLCVNFGDEILLRGEECKTWEKFNFSEKGKTVISVENWKFFRSQMTKRTASLNSSCEI